MKIESYQPSFSGGVLWKGDKSLFHLLPRIDKLDPGFAAKIICTRVPGGPAPDHANAILTLNIYSEKPVPKFLNFLKIFPSYARKMLSTKQFRVNTVDPGDVNKNAYVIRDNLHYYMKSFLHVN
ncbi:MAG: hypothetical protein LBK53_02095 [Heliobacteriaceae bacterium]|jgi:hypothetical protein|nr:hypothetical protein [Heliobacteriaceae bacterium]